MYYDYIKYGERGIYALKRQLEQVPAASSEEYFTKEMRPDTQSSVYILWGDGMKKLVMIGIFVVSICLSFFAGNYFCDKENIKLREQRCHTMIGFAIDKLDDIKTKYDADVMETLISDVYAAYESSNNGELSSALHDLWNALIFDGENIVGKENDLIAALKEKNAQSIKEIAHSMRTPK